MVYTSDDPIVARQLEDIGCCAIMPLATPDRLEHGHSQPVEPATDSGAARCRCYGWLAGTASDAAIAMELGCQGVDEHRHCRRWQDPIRMAHAMRLA